MQTWQQGLSAESRLNKMPNLSNEIAAIQTYAASRDGDSLPKALPRSRSNALLDLFGRGRLTAIIVGHRVVARRQKKKKNSRPRGAAIDSRRNASWHWQAR
jgi:hypothetical protein